MRDKSRQQYAPLIVANEIRIRDDHTRKEVDGDDKQQQESTERNDFRQEELAQ